MKTTAARARLTAVPLWAVCLFGHGLAGDPGGEAGDDGSPTDRPYNVSVGDRDWPQLGGSPARNNAVDVEVPATWDVEKGTNVKWSVELGTQTYGNTVVANGKVFIGTNNGHPRRERVQGDHGVMLCFRESDGGFLWQHSSEKLATGRVHDWPEQGVCSAPVAEGDRLWFVTNRGEVVCLDSEGFRDGEDDGPATGVWARAFETVADLRGLADVNESHVPQDYQIALRGIVEHSGFRRPDFIAPAAEPSQWLATKGYNPRVEICRITLEGDVLRLIGLGEYEGKQAKADVDQLAGLNDERLSGLLRTHFEASGLDVSAVARPTTVEPGRSWTVTASSEGELVHVRLAVEDERLVAYRRIDADLEHEADVVWSLDMMAKLGVRQHNMATCAPTIWGDVLFVCTSNGVDEAHLAVPAPDAPSFLALHKRTGEILWTDASPGRNILHGQWSCPAVGVFGGVPQVIFPGGDGWLYAFRADRWDEAAKRPELLWKFDANPKASIWELGGRGTRNEIIAVPVLHDALVYTAVGQDPEHGEGVGHLWCIDPTKRGDVSPELVVDERGKVQPHQNTRSEVSGIELFRVSPEIWEGLDQGTVSERLRQEFRQAGIELPASVRVTAAGRDAWHLAAEMGDEVVRFHLVGQSVLRDDKWDRLLIARPAVDIIPNPNSAVVWHYDGADTDGDGKKDGFYETMHRTLASSVIKNGILVITDLSGLVHCLDAKTGKLHWTCDLLAACWATPLIAGEQVLVGDEDGEVAVLPLSAQLGDAVKLRRDKMGRPWREPTRQNLTKSSIYTSPVVANGVLYVADRSRLYAIAVGDDDAP